MSRIVRRFVSPSPPAGPEGLSNHTARADRSQQAREPRHLRCSPLSVIHNNHGKQNRIYGTDVVFLQPCPPAPCAFALVSVTRCMSQHQRLCFYRIAALARSAPTQARPQDALSWRHDSAHDGRRRPSAFHGVATLRSNGQYTQSQNSAERTGPAENLPGSLLSGPGSRSGFAVVEIDVAAIGSLENAVPAKNSYGCDVGTIESDNTREVTAHLRSYVRF